MPGGGKDVRKIMRIPYRRMDLPPRSVKHVRTDETHRVEWLGPPKDRDPEYIRDREFDHLSPVGRRSLLTPLSKDEIRAHALDHGIDLVGFCG